MVISSALLKSRRWCFSSSSHLVNHFYSTYSDQKELSLLLQAPLPRTHLLEIHGRVFRAGAHQDNLIATRLIGRHQPHLALRVLNQLHHPSIFPFNASIRILSESQHSCPAALSLFKSLKLRSLSPNDFTFSFLLKVCLRSPDASQVRQVHTHIIKSCFGCDSAVFSGLLLAYWKGVGDIGSARAVFDEMPCRGGNVSSWACLISAYSQLGRPEKSLMLFLSMLDEGLRPDDDTMVGVLSACSNLKNQKIEEWVNVFSKFSDDSDRNRAIDSVGAALIYLFGKWGKIERSRELFEKIHARGRGVLSVVIWNAMIGGFVQNGLLIEALDLFCQMVSCSNPKPNHVTVVSVLSACAQLGDLDLGRWAHKYMKAKGCKGMIESNTILATAFIDMYSKCGSLREAEEVFSGLTKKDVISFNAMIMGVAVNGQGREALRLFQEMKRVGVHPSDGTFLGLLCACTHSGLISEGRALFEGMDQHYLVTPKLEHYTCFIDLLSRAGHIEEALEVVKAMPVEPNGQVWGALLGACLVHSRVDVARDVAKKLVDVDPKNSAGYVMLSNAFAIDQQWGKITGLRALMKERSVNKQPGCSWISIGGVMHEFLVGCTSHSEIQRIHLLLDNLFKEMRLISN